jgi:hypothetical protein
LEKVGADPGFDTLGFTGLHGFLHPGKVDVLGGQQDAADGVAVHRLHQGGHRLLQEVDALDDDDLRALLIGEGADKAVHVLGSAGDQDRLAARAGLQPPPHDLTLDRLPEQQGDTSKSHPEEKHRAAGHIPAQEDGDAADDHADDHKALDELADGFCR